MSSEIRLQWKPLELYIFDTEGVTLIYELSTAEFHDFLVSFSSGHGQFSVLLFLQRVNSVK